MATSSILENIYVNNPKAIEEFVAAMDSPEKYLTGNCDHTQAIVMADPEKARSLMLKGIENRGNL